MTGVQTCSSDLDLHYFAGLEQLLRAFYLAVLDRGSPPIAPAHVRRVAMLMDHLVRAHDVRYGARAAEALPALEL